MPANLPPQYFEVEKKLKTARDAQEKIAVMEELLSIIPKHKGTEKLQALYKTKIAKLRQEAQKKTGAAKQGPSHHIDKAGAGQVVLAGPPNSGKSSLIAAVTNASPEIGDYPFTTHTASPAMMKYQNVQIQLVDMPPITQDFFEPWQAELIKNADGVLLVLDLGNRNTALDCLTVLERLGERRIELVPPGTPEEASPRFLKKTLLMANKIDLPGANDILSELADFLESGLTPLPCSVLNASLLESWKTKIWSLLGVLRVYSKIPGRKPKFEEPFIFPQGSTLLDMARSVHRDFAANLKYARIWGEGKYEGQMVQRDYLLRDGDVIELHI